MLPGFRPLVVGVMVPILLLLVPYFYTTARVDAACFSAVGVFVMLPILLLLVPPFTKPRG